MERGVRVAKVEQQALLQLKISVHHTILFLFPLLTFLLIALLSFRPYFQHLSRLIAHHQLLTRKDRQLRYHRQVKARQYRRLRHLRKAQVQRQQKK